MTGLRVLNPQLASFTRIGPWLTLDGPETRRAALLHLHSGQNRRVLRFSRWAVGGTSEGHISQFGHLLLVLNCR